MRETVLEKEYSAEDKEHLNALFCSRNVMTVTTAHSDLSEVSAISLDCDECQHGFYCGPMEKCRLKELGLECSPLPTADSMFTIGDIVKHFKYDFCTHEAKEQKRYLYQILNFATNTDTEETMVVYKALYPPFKTWVRTESQFCSLVDKEKYPAAKQLFKFMKIEGEIHE